MNLTYELVKTEIGKLEKGLCQRAKASSDGKKFSLLMLKKLSGYKNIKLLGHYSDGGGDHQIDGVYFVEDGEELQVHILTCSFNSNGKCIEDKDITDLANNGLNYILFGDEKVSDFNFVIKSIREEFNELCKDFEGKFTVMVKFISSSDEVLSHNGESIFSKYQVDLQSKGIEIDFEKVNSKKISAIFSLKSVLNTAMPIKLSGKAYYGFVGREGFVCRLPVQELINIYCGFKDGEKEYQGYGDFLFEDNVRKNLGLEKKINNNIYSTATDSKGATDFEYFNNGLTIIYDDKSGSLVGDSPVLYIKRLQVVNGCQTISTLIKAFDDKKLKDDIYVTCKFIKRSDDEEFIKSVITCTNSQNAISDRDLHANDRIQCDVQGILRNIGIFYEKKLNEFKEEDDDLRLDALDAAQSYLCCELQEPNKAKQDKRKLFKDLYHKIFDHKNIDLPYKLLLSVNVIDYVLTRQSEGRAKKRKSKKLGKRPRFSITDLTVAHGSYHLAEMVYRELFYGLSHEKIEEAAKRPKLPEKVERIYTKVLDLLVKHIEDKKVKREEIPQFFKITGKCV